MLSATIPFPVEIELLPRRTSEMFGFGKSSDANHRDPPSPASPAWFDDTFYLQTNPDVAAAVRRGDFASGYEHFARHGEREGRSANIEQCWARDDETFASTAKPQSPLVLGKGEYEAMSPSQKRAFLRGLYSAIFRSPPLFPPGNLQGSNFGQDRDIWGYRLGAIELADLVITHCGLQPNQRILDVGSGTGKLASALIHFLCQDGRYDGFDIAEESVDWCTSVISKKYPHFRFSHVDIANEAYSRASRQSADKFVFPYDQNSFDVVMAASVLTHMDLRSGLHYFDEIQRVLQPSGKAAVTLFILNEQEATPINVQTGPIGVGGSWLTHNFISREPGFYFHCDDEGQPKRHFSAVSDCGDPVAYAERWLVEELRTRGWSDVCTVWGRWRTTGLNPPYQDAVILTK
jgi:SAM-dependent methyltransferase